MGGLKILDNGAAEHALVTPHELLTTAGWVGVDEVVIPDALGDCNGTIQKARDFERAAKRHPEFKYIGVVQGRTLAEVVKCLTAFTYMDYITVLALPRSLCTIHRMQRYYMAEMANEMFADRWPIIHCLGSSRWTHEVVLLTEVETIRGYDSAMPFVMGMGGKILGVNDESYEYEPHGMEYFEHKSNSIERGFIERNIHTFDDWAKAPTRQL